MPTVRCFQIHAGDSVATMLDDARTGDAVSIVGRDVTPLRASGDIKLAHKIALRDIALDQPIMKFGVPIGRATRKILAGEWVHLHNCASSVDQRSQTLDVHTGAVTDTKYE